MMGRNLTTQKGSVMLPAMVGLIALLALGGLTVLFAKRSARATANQRFRVQANYAAESGIAAAMSYLRGVVDPQTGWSALVNPNNENPQSPAEIFGNGLDATDTGNPFEVQSRYTVTVLNNPGDPGFATGDDTDMRIVLRSEGVGPANARVVIQVEVAPNEFLSRAHCPGYGQEGLSSDGSGRNDCLGAINSNSEATFKPEL